MCVGQCFKAKNWNWELCSSQPSLDVAPGQVSDKVSLVHICGPGFRREGIPFWGPAFTSLVLIICVS